MKIVIRSFAGGHGRVDAALVSVSVTLPAAISAAVGVYVAFNAEALGLYDPAPPLHVPAETVPVIEPWSWTLGLLAHTV